MEGGYGVALVGMVDRPRQAEGFQNEGVSVAPACDSGQDVSGLGYRKRTNERNLKERKAGSVLEV